MTLSRTEGLYINSTENEIVKNPSEGISLDATFVSKSTYEFKIEAHKLY